MPAFWDSVSSPDWDPTSPWQSLQPLLTQTRSLLPPDWAQVTSVGLGLPAWIPCCMGSGPPPRLKPGISPLLAQNRAQCSPPLVAWDWTYQSPHHPELALPTFCHLESGLLPRCHPPAWTAPAAPDRGPPLPGSVPAYPPPLHSCWLTCGCWHCSGGAGRERKPIHHFSCHSLGWVQPREQ